MNSIRDLGPAAVELAAIVDPSADRTGMAADVLTLSVIAPVFAAAQVMVNFIPSTRTPESTGSTCAVTSFGVPETFVSGKADAS